jgi:hypothetical protein
MSSSHAPTVWFQWLSFGLNGPGATVFKSIVDAAPAKPDRAGVRPRQLVKHGPVGHRDHPAGEHQLRHALESVVLPAPDPPMMAVSVPGPQQLAFDGPLLRQPVDALDIDPRAVVAAFVTVIGLRPGRKLNRCCYRRPAVG